MSTIKLKRIKQAVDTGVTQPLSIGGVASDNSDEVMNIASNGDLQFKKIIQTNGIKFPATQVPSADPNTLDDYEEGTFTPVIEGLTTTGVGTYSNRVGIYTKIGRVVHFTMYISTSSHTGTGGIAISGLPFNIGGDFVFSCWSDILSLGSNNTLSAILGGINPNTYQRIYLSIQPVGGGGWNYVPIDQEFNLKISGTYFTS